MYIVITDITQERVHESTAVPDRPPIVNNQQTVALLKQIVPTSKEHIIRRGGEGTTMYDNDHWSLCLCGVIRGHKTRIRPILELDCCLVNSLDIIHNFPILRD